VRDPHGRSSRVDRRDTIVVFVDRMGDAWSDCDGRAKIAGSIWKKERISSVTEEKVAYIDQ